MLKLDAATALFWINYATSMRGTPQTFAERMMVQALATERLAQATGADTLQAAEALALLFAERFPNAAYLAA
jgi:hypothetical protein